MNQKRLYDAAMIFVIGITPLGFEYLKQHVENTKIIQKIQNDIDEHQSTDNTLFKPRLLVTDLLFSPSLPKISQSIEKRIQLLKNWKSSTPETYLTQVFSITGLHTIGGLLYPSAFFLSILSYFILYQMNFVNQYFILSGKQRLFNSQRFSFEKINNMYLYLGLSGIGLAVLGKTFGKLNQKAFNKTFK